MFTTFSATGPSRTQVRAGLVGAHANDPVVHEDIVAPRAPRTRSALSSALHHLADAVGPGEVVTGTGHRRAA
jgi:hypothetical protein